MSISVVAQDIRSSFLDESLKSSSIVLYNRCKFVNFPTFTQYTRAVLCGGADGIEPNSLEKVAIEVEYRGVPESVVFYLLPSSLTPH